jgi:hypothetical protein
MVYWTLPRQVNLFLHTIQNFAQTQISFKLLQPEISNAKKYSCAVFKQKNIVIKTCL